MQNPNNLFESPDSGLDNMIIVGFVFLGLVALVSLVLLIGFAWSIRDILFKTIENSVKMDQLIVNSNKIDELIITTNKLGTAVEFMADTSGGLVDVLMSQGMPSGTAPRGLKGATHFSTEDGKVQANNIDEFIAKLQSHPEYKDIADSLKKQLEDELKDLEDDDEDSSPF